MQTDSARDAHGQRRHAVRFDWGLVGADAIGWGVDFAAVVDVLSFTTTLTVAADQGTHVYPYQSGDDTARDFAAHRQAILAVGRLTAGPGQISLSPASIRAAPTVSRLVLPSLNGSAISAHLQSTAAQVVGVSLRNRRAVAKWLLGRRRTHPHLRVAVIAAGERWRDGTLRPAVEDLWGAGSLVSALAADGWVDLSPEANAAKVSFESVENDIADALMACASGQELAGFGFSDDVQIAAELDQSCSLPVLQGAAFQPEHLP